jgi:hypothetical protein
LQDALKKSIGESHDINISSVDFSIARKIYQVSELFVAIFGGVVAMKKGGKKYIIYVVSNSYVSSSFYLKVVLQPMWMGPGRADDRVGWL